MSVDQASLLRSLVEKYALTFLRKAAVLIFVRYGLDFECPYNIDIEANEIERLTALLHIPSIDDMCTTLISVGIIIYALLWPTRQSGDGRTQDARRPRQGSTTVPTFSHLAPPVPEMAIAAGRGNRKRNAQPAMAISQPSGRRAAKLQAAVLMRT